MRRTTSRRALIAGGIGTALLGGFSLGRTQNPEQNSHSTPGVTCTVGMITDVAKNIGDEHFTFGGLMGAGIDPHLYKPSAGDIVRLGDADLILYGGLHLEGRMTETLETIHNSGQVRTRAVSESIPTDRLIPVSETSWDPHVWFDVSLWTIVAETITEELVALDPGNAGEISSRAEAYRSRLDELETWVFREIERVPEDIRVLVTAHDAFSYFGQRYGFEVIGLQGLSTATEAGAGDVQELADMISERKIPAIFVESSIPRATIEAVQEATRSRGWDVKIGGSLYSDAMGESGTPDGTYIGMVRHNISTIVEALVGGS